MDEEYSITFSVIYYLSLFIINSNNFGELHASHYRKVREMRERYREISRKTRTSEGQRNLMQNGSRGGRGSGSKVGGVCVFIGRRAPSSRAFCVVLLFSPTILQCVPLSTLIIDHYIPPSTSVHNILWCRTGDMYCISLYSNFH